MNLYQLVDIVAVGGRVCFAILIATEPNLFVAGGLLIAWTAVSTLG